MREGDEMQGMEEISQAIGRSVKYDGVYILARFDGDRGHELVCEHVSREN